MFVNMRRKIIFKVVLLITVLGLTLAGCAQGTTDETKLIPVKVMLDWVPNTNHTGIYVAKEKGWYEDAGLDVEIVRPPEGGTAQLIGAGQGDFGISYQEEVTYARSNNLPVVSVAAVIQHNTSGFASPKERNITSAKDFEGKKYGGWGSPVENAVIESIMKKENADIKQVEFINIGTNDFFTLAKRGDIDFAWIYYGWTGIEAEIRDYPLNYLELRNLETELDFYTPLIIVNETYIKENPDNIKKFLEATTKGYEFAIENPQEAAQSLLSQEQGMDKELVENSQEWLAAKYQEDAEQWGIQKQAVWENYAKWMVKSGLIPEMIDVEKAFTNEFLPER